MVESRFHTREVHRFAQYLSAAKRPRDLLSAKAVLGRDSYGIDAMVSLPFYEEGNLPVFVAPSIMPRKYVVPYLYYPHVYFVLHEPLVRLLLKIGYIIIFDTNFASYVDKVVREEPLKRQQEEVMQVIDDIIYNDLNFDPASFYLLENIKQAYPIALRMNGEEISSPHKFWNLLDESFRQNIVSLQLFRDVDCQHYRKTRKLKFKISYEEAVTRSIDLTYKFYASSEGQELVSHFIFLQKVILYQLLAILKIQFSSKRGAKAKIAEFLELVQKESVYFDRETIVAHKYFKDAKTIRLLESVNRGTQTDLWDKIDNLAWDMTAPRYMERVIALEGEADFLMPYFLTFDRNLRELIACYPAKAIVIDRRSRGVLTIPMFSTHEYFEKEKCWHMISNFFSAEKQNERSANVVPLEVLSDRVSTLYADLNAILS